VKSGIKNLMLLLEETNIMSRRASFFWTHYSKVAAMKLYLESMHPEIIVNAKNELLAEDILKNDINGGIKMNTITIVRIS
jgi:hypothetical protein